MTPSVYAAFNQIPMLSMPCCCCSTSLLHNFFYGRLKNKSSILG